jgi:hypothetical protein
VQLSRDIVPRESHTFSHANPRRIDFVGQLQILIERQSARTDRSVAAVRRELCASASLSESSATGAIESPQLS